MDGPSASAREIPCRPANKALCPIYFNKRSVFMSCLMLLNVAVMPLKAYISEPFPWEPIEPTEFLTSCTPNVTQCLPEVLKFLQNKSHTMPIHQTHISKGLWDLFRFSLPPLPAQDSSPTNYLRDLPFYNFYTPNQRDQVVKLVRRDVNIGDYQSIQVEVIFGVTFSYVVLWAEPMDSLYVGFLKEPTTRTWLAFKFLYRICFCVYITVCMWRQYFQYYLHLAAKLRTFGLEGATMTDPIEVVMGDPTSIILLNPYVSVIFIIDVWVSMEYITATIAKLNQLDDAKELAIACFYLSRTLWFAYGTLNAVSYLLKKLHWEHSFTEADPTLTAVFVFIAVGPITKLQALAPFFVDLYYNLFRAFARDDNSNELSIAIMLYTLIIGSLPVVFGFLSKHLYRRRKPRVAPLITYGSFKMNGIKHRLTHHFNFMSLSDPAFIVKGGSLYQLFATDCKFKQSLAISQRGADCYLLFGVGHRRTSVRLSLLSCIDTKHHIPSTTNPTAAFGQLHFEGDQVRLVCGAANSPWTA